MIDYLLPFLGDGLIMGGDSGLGSYEMGVDISDLTYFTSSF